MAQVEAKEAEGGLVLALTGKIDSQTAPEVEAEMLRLRSEKGAGSLTLDCAKLDYISSAGLRILLRLSKEEPSLKLVNVSNAVYEVFEMTGFNELLTIEKAYRVLSVEGCEVIGQGSNGKVYRLDGDTIIKVYNNPDSLPDIKRETALARYAFVHGLPTSIPYDVVKVGNSYGSVFEMLNATNFSKLIMAHPEKMDDYVDLCVQLMWKIHGTEAEPGALPDMREVGLKWGEFLKDYLPKEEEDKLLSLLGAVPENHHMIHGDFHTRNVMMQNDEVMLIDMDTLAMGHPIYELAAMYLDYVGFRELTPTEGDGFVGLPYAVACEFFKRALPRYLRTTDEKFVQSVLEKAMIVGYTRLMRRTIKRIGVGTPVGQPLIDNCKKHLADLLPRVDSLAY